MNKRELIGIVVLNYKTWEKTISCVQSIFDTYTDDKIIVIVDNHSPNASYRNLVNKYDSELYKDVFVIQTTYNGGFSYGNNFGYNFLTNKYPNINKIVFTNNDIVFGDHSIVKMIEGFGHSDHVVITSPLILNTDKRKTNNPWKEKPDLLQLMGLYNNKEKLFQWDELKENTLVYMTSGCCFSVDKHLFNSIHCFDENVFLYNEENILSYKISDNNLSIVFCPESNIIHDHGSTTGRRSIFVDKEYVKSCLYFLRNYEHFSKLSISFLKIYFMTRIAIKTALGRYHHTDGFFKSLSEIISE